MAQLSSKEKKDSLLSGKVLILDGPPASGKGSIAQALRERFGCVHISTGDVFRDHVARDTELGRQAKKYLDMKSFVPDALVVNLVLDRMSQPDVKQFGCILDGFPRTPLQKSALEAANVSIRRVIRLQCPDNVLLKRAKGRRIDPQTGNIYHIEYVPAPKEVMPRLIKRDMDSNIQSRLDVYHAQHRRFKYDRNQIINVNGNKPMREVLADVLRILKADHANDTSDAMDIDSVETGATAQVKLGACTVCLDKAADFIIVPCGHQCGCEACLTQLKEGGFNCPMCRGPIHKIQKVYATYDVTINVPKKKKQAPRGVPDIQQIANIEDEIFAVNDDEKWPQDAPDDETEESKANANDDAISIRIAPAQIDNEIHNIVLEVTTPASIINGRVAVDICAVLDVSGSMCSSAAVQEDDGSVKHDDGLSVLDLVKHSVKTVMHCLGEKDRLSIVPFSSDAKIHHPLSYMTAQGIKEAEAALDELQPGGTTNLWEGLRMGMESLRTKKEDGRLPVVMLLTDGRPTIIPPKGEIHELSKYCDMHAFAVQINTFGFGYDLDSELLHALAVFGAGTFAFIPDAKIVGTTFVNSISNVLTTVSPKSTMHLTPVNGAKFVGAKSWGGHKEQNESWGKLIEFGPITAGGTRYISVPMCIPPAPADAPALLPYLECVLNVFDGKSLQKISVIGVERTVASDLFAGHLTAKAVSIGTQATELCTKRKGNAALKLLKTLKLEVKAAAEIATTSDTDDFNQMSANSRLVALNADVNGRLNKAFQGQPRFNRWGKHYLRALLRAHSVNLCTNFMDPGLQVNGGDLFRSLRAKGDEVFINLPAPKPSRQTGPTLAAQQRGAYYQPYQPQQYQQRQQAQPQPQYRPPPPRPAPSIDMSDYYGGAGGGCFAPYCSVEVMDPCSKQWICTQVCDVTVGDAVKVAGGACATVLFAVQLARDSQRRMLSFAGGLVITGGHPIRRNGVWCRPREQSDAQIHEGCDTVYTFVLDASHVLLVNGMECVTWGHGMKDAVVNDPFYGTQRVIEALKRGVIGNQGFGEIVIM